MLYALESPHGKSCNGSANGRRLFVGGMFLILKAISTGCEGNYSFSAAISQPNESRVFDFTNRGRRLIVLESGAALTSAPTSTTHKVASFRKIA